MSELYKKSGVDLSEADKLCKNINVLGSNFIEFVGGVSFEGFKILHCCDGIGSKIIPLYNNKLYKTIATDIVAANLNDLATKNAVAIAFSDYISVNKLDADAVSEIVKEIHGVLTQYNCKLVGGETSEIPALIKEKTIDICGFVIGVEKGEECLPVCSGDVVIGLKSSGIHANGFTLIRKLHAEGVLTDSEFNECLNPTYIYYNVLQQLWDRKLLKSASNITGGGIIANLSRVIPQDLKAELDLLSIPKQTIYEKLYKICKEEMFEIFNCGVGFCLIADSKDVMDIMEISKEFEPFILGKVCVK